MVADHVFLGGRGNRVGSFPRGNHGAGAETLRLVGFLGRSPPQLHWQWVVDRQPSLPSDSASIPMILHGREGLQPIPEQQINSYLRRTLRALTTVNRQCCWQLEHQGELIVVHPMLLATRLSGSSWSRKHSLVITASRIAATQTLWGQSSPSCRSQRICAG